jgi:hypothetical protein
MFESVIVVPREMPVPYGATQITDEVDDQDVVAHTVLWMREVGVKSSDPKLVPSIVTWPPAVFGPLYNCMNEMVGESYENTSESEATMLLTVSVNASACALPGELAHLVEVSVCQTVVAQIVSPSFAVGDM